jgi:hypothetical protein
MDYVLGFQFDQKGSNVALILKNRPEWQAGFWNGIGGHVEPQESPDGAMAREFYEETGMPQDHVVWHPFARLDTWMRDRVFLFSSFSDQVGVVRTVTDEPVAVFTVPAVLTMGVKSIINVPYLVAMALSQRSTRSTGGSNGFASYMILTELVPHNRLEAL